jgi:hypothetical protein
MIIVEKFKIERKNVENTEAHKIYYNGLRNYE